MTVPDPSWAWRLALHAMDLDADGHDTVSSGLADLIAAVFGYQAHGNTGATETFDASAAGWHSATLNANCTFTFTGATSGEVWSLVLELAQDGTGSRTVTWPGSVVWPGGVAPTLSTAAGAVDVLTFFSRDGGTTWYGFPTGGSGGSALTIKEEGSSLATAATSIDFVGAGITASGTGAAKTVTLALALDNLTDAAVSSPVTGDRLRYDGTNFVNSALIFYPVMANDGTNWYVVVDGDGTAVMAEA